MAFVKRFENDVFISYAHADNEPLPGDEKGWVSELVEGIYAGLGFEGLRDYKVWVDHQLAGNVDLTEQLVGHLDSSAVLLVILSRAYLASEWCRLERNAFLERVAERRTRNDRIFVVECDRITESRPQPFERLPGFRFWQADTLSQRARRLTPRFKDAYDDAIGGLCRNLADELRRLNGEPTPGEVAPTVTHRSESAHTVLLAEVTDDLDAKREKVRSYLEQRGVRIIPAADALYATDPAAFQDELSRDLAVADVFVQLLGAFPGKRSKAATQYALASTSGTPILQWRAPDLDVGAVESPEQRELLHGSTVRAESLEAFSKHVVELLERPAAPEPATGNRGSALVFVNMDQPDQELARRVCRKLKEHGIGFSLPLMSAPPDKKRADLDENLQYCDAVIVIYGETDINWVRRQLLRHWRALAARTQPLLAFTVYQGAKERVDLDFSVPGVEFVEVTQGDIEDKVAQFARSLQGVAP